MGFNYEVGGEGESDHSDKKAPTTTFKQELRGRGIFKFGPHSRWNRFV